MAIIYYILLLLNLFSFLLGYLYGNRSIVNHEQDIKYHNKNSQAILKNKTSNITIDDTKIITKIDTSDLEKKYDQLGDNKSSQDSISSSVNKLKNIKPK